VENFVDKMGVTAKLRVQASSPTIAHPPGTLAQSSGQNRQPPFPRRLIPNVIECGIHPTGLPSSGNPSPQDSLTTQLSCSARARHAIIHLGEIALSYARCGQPAGNIRADDALHPDSLSPPDEYSARKSLARKGTAVSESPALLSYPHFYPQARSMDPKPKRRNSVHNRDGDIFVNNRPRLPQNRLGTGRKDNPAHTQALAENPMESALNTRIYWGKAVFSLSCAHKPHAPEVGPERCLVIRKKMG